MSEANGSSVRALGTSTCRPVFTIEQANHSLPLVGRILGDIVKQYRLVERFRKRCRRFSGQNRPLEARAAEAKGLEAAHRLSDLTDELSSIGCEVKDYERGFVDFPAVLDGRDVYLCWKLGEDRIGYWHDRSAGETQRRKLPGAFTGDGQRMRAE